MPNVIWLKVSVSSDYHLLYIRCEHPAGPFFSQISSFYKKYMSWCIGIIYNDAPVCHCCASLIQASDVAVYDDHKRGPADILS